LNLVKTSTAKNRIRQWLKKEQREENIHTIEKLKPEKKELLKVEDFQQLKIEPRSLSTRDGVRQGIKIKGIDNLLVHLAHCCNPVPGDTISGYITRGRGVSVHLADCRNINLLRTREKERIVEVFWSKEFQSPFQVKLEVLAMDRAGLLNDVMAVLTELKISANWVTARGRKNNQATVELALEIKNVEQLNFIISRINRVKDVYEIKRTS
jgi:GTP pyrophosphokinase